MLGPSAATRAQPNLQLIGAGLADCWRASRRSGLDARRAQQKGRQVRRVPRLVALLARRTRACRIQRGDRLPLAFALARMVAAVPLAVRPIGAGPACPAAATAAPGGAVGGGGG